MGFHYFTSAKVGTRFSCTPDKGRPLDKRAKIDKVIFHFSTKTYVVATQKNRFNETGFLSAQNKC